MFDFIIGISIMILLVSITSYISRKINPPNFHNDNYINNYEYYGDELIYSPIENYMDKLEYKEHDMNKRSILKESSPIPRHPSAYGSWALSASELADKVQNPKNRS